MRLSDARALIKWKPRRRVPYDRIGSRVRFESLHREEYEAQRFSAKPKIIRDIYSHDLSKLITAAKLQTALDAERRRNTSLDNKWAVVIKDWNINSRYAVGGLNARDLYRAVAGRNGVMQWLRQRW